MVSDKLSDYPGSCREVFRIALPLILSTASLTLMLFVDRMFLAWYGIAEVAAAVPAGITSFTISSFFIGIAEYTNTLVAQYYGAGRKPECALAVVQGLIFAVLVIPLILLCIPLGLMVFDWAGHEPAIVALEKEYFILLMIGGCLLPFNAALSCFFSGRGRTAQVLWGNLAANLANIGVAYTLIFGKFGFPELGIRGAGIATAVTNIIPTIYWAVLFLSPKYRKDYKTRSAFRFNQKIFTILLKFGVPAGTQFFLDIAAFTVFVLLVGRLGEINLAASNIVLSIELIDFLPMVGLSIAAMTLVGQYIGRGRHDYAEKSVISALKLSILYTGPLGMAFFVAPELFLNLFSTESEAQDFAGVLETAKILIRFVALYAIFDGVFIIFAGALKGAGDTKFAMWAQIVIAWGLFVVPVYFGITHLHWGIFSAWAFVIMYVVLLGSVFYLRFRSGKWKRMKVIT